MRRIFSRNNHRQGQGMVEVGLVAGIIAILMIASFAIMIHWSGQKFVNESKTVNATAEFNDTFGKLK